MKSITATTISTYNAVAKEYSEKYFGDTSDFDFINPFISSLPLHSRVLDLGSGPGQFSKYLSSKRVDVTGIDLSDEMLRIAKKEVPDVNFIKMDMRSLKFSDEHFDGLIAPYSLIHIPDTEVVSTLKEWNRVLKKDGYLSVLVQEGESDHWVSQPFAPEKQIFFNFFTIERVQKYLEESGFSTVSVKKIPCEDDLVLSKSLLYFLAKKSRNN